MSEIRRILAELAPLAAQTLPLWHNAAVMGLFGVFLASISLWAALVWPE